MQFGIRFVSSVWAPLDPTFGKLVFVSPCVSVFAQTWPFYTMLFCTFISQVLNEQNENFSPFGRTFYIFREKDSRAILRILSSPRRFTSDVKFKAFPQPSNLYHPSKYKKSSPSFLDNLKMIQHYRVSTKTLFEHKKYGDIFWNLASLRLELYQQCLCCRAFKIII